MKKKEGDVFTFWPKIQKWPLLGPIWSILTQNAQKQRLFAFFFSKTANWNFLFLCMKPSLWSRKNDDLAFLLKIQKWPILAQIDPNLTTIWEFWLSKMFSFLIFFLQKSKREKNSTFHHFYPHYDLPLPTLSKFSKCLKLRFSHFFREKNGKFVFYYFSWDMVSIVAIFLTFYYTQIWPFWPKMVKIRSFLAFSGPSHRFSKFCSSKICYILFLS